MTSNKTVFCTLYLKKKLNQKLNLFHRDSILTLRTLESVHNDYDDNVFQYIRDEWNHFLKHTNNL